jgi:hypothetical protein
LRLKQKSDCDSGEEAEVEAGPSTKVVSLLAAEITYLGEKEENQS